MEDLKSESVMSNLESSEQITKKAAAIEVYKVLEESRAVAIMGIVGVLLSAITPGWVSIASAMAFCGVISYSIYKTWLRMNNLKEKYKLVVQSRLNKKQDG